MSPSELCLFVFKTIPQSPSGLELKLLPGSSLELWRQRLVNFCPLLAIFLVTKRTAETAEL